jgi:hypothetical protein
LYNLATVFDFSNAPSGGVGLLMQATGINAMWGGGVRNVNFYCSPNPVKGSGSVGIRLAGAQYGRIKDCVVSGFDFCVDAIDINTLGAVSIYNQLEGLRFERYSTSALRLLGAVATQVNFCEFNGGYGSYDQMLLMSKALYNAQGCDSNHFTDCVFIDGAALSPVIVNINDGASGLGLDTQFVNCQFEQASGPAIQMSWSAASADNTIRHLYVDRCGFNNVQRAVFNAGHTTQGSIMNSRINTTGSGGAIHYVSTDAATATTDFQICNNHISVGHASGQGVYLYRGRGFLVQGNTIRMQGAASANPAILVDTTVDQAKILNNHSVTTFATTDGTQNIGTNTVTANNTKAAS